MLEVVILKITPNLSRNEFETLLRLVTKEKQKRINKIHFYQDAQNCLLGDVLVRSEICRLTGLKNKQLSFSTNIYGKPLLGNIDSMHFNITHAGDYLACALSDEPIGVDIELIKTADMQIATRFFTLDETAYIKQGNQVHRFYEVWTKKESYIKWEGTGLHKSLSSFSVFGAKVTYRNILHTDSAIGHTCSMKQEIPSVRMVSSTEFMNNFDF